jgi:hypothetical protein
MYKENATLHIKYFPKCSASCTTTCPHCVIDTLGTFTGRTWRNEVMNVTYYEVKYKHDQHKKKMCGVFTENELTIVQDKHKASVRNITKSSKDNEEYFKKLKPKKRFYRKRS